MKQNMRCRSCVRRVRCAQNALAKSEGDPRPPGSAARIPRWQDSAEGVVVRVLLGRSRGGTPSPAAGQCSACAQAGNSTRQAAATEGKSPCGMPTRFKRGSWYETRKDGAGTCEYVPARTKPWLQAASEKEGNSDHGAMFGGIVLRVHRMLRRCKA